MSPAVQDVPRLVVVERVDHRRDKADRRVRLSGLVHLADLLDDLQLDVEQGSPAGLDVVFLAEAIELQINRVEARLGDLLEEAFLRRDPDPVRRDLDLTEPHLLRGLHDLGELRVNRRLAPRELDRGHRDRALCPQDRELVDDLLERRLEHISGRVRVREADIRPRSRSRSRSGTSGCTGS